MLETILREEDISTQKEVAERYRLSIEGFCNTYLPGVP